MPELPEVETVVRTIRPALIHRTIVQFDAWWPRVTAPFPPLEIRRRLTGRTIRQVERRAKFIIFHLDRGFLHLHLRMTGRLMIQPADAVAETTGIGTKHISAEWLLDDGSRMIFRDTRKFGRLGFTEDLSGLFSRLGPEPLESTFTAEVFMGKLAGRRRKIKPLLLDQGFLAGLGNIYVDEALFQARIHPETSAAEITKPGARQLHRAIQDILTSSIEHNGTTVIDFRFGEDRSGEFSNHLKIFGKKGDACPRCGTLIIKLRVAQRGTYICPRCQETD